MITRIAAMIPATPRHMVEDTLGFAAICVMVIGSMLLPGMI